MANAIVKSQSQTSTLHMAISPINELTTTWSPEIHIHGIPWKIKASKDADKNSLSVYLYCEKKDDSSNWTVPACATIDLLSFADGKKLHKRHIGPYVFSLSSLAFGYTSFIQWDDLLKAENKYVKDDTIELKVEVSSADPAGSNRSILKFEDIDKSCNCGSTATFRLTVTNVENLMAVRSPKFILRGLRWVFMVFKDQSSTLGIMLESKEPVKKVSCKTTMSAKLLASNNSMNSMKKSNTDQVQWPGNLKIVDIISWNEMLKPQNGFVNNNSITLEVEIKADKPVGDVANLDANIAAKHPRFECSVCLDGLSDQDISSTPCGHMFCTACITTALQNHGVCPLCKKAVQLNDLRRMYLSAPK